MDYEAEGSRTTTPLIYVNIALLLKDIISMERLSVETQKESSDEYDRMESTPGNGKYA